MNKKLLKALGFALFSIAILALSLFNELGYFKNKPLTKPTQPQTIESFTITPEGKFTDFKSEKHRQ